MEVLQSKKKYYPRVPSVKEADGVLYGCTILELKEYLETEELSELCEYLTGQYSDGWLTMTVGGIPVLAAGDPCQSSITCPPLSSP